VVLTGEDLVTVRDGIGAIDGGWRFAGPETIEPTAEYTLALSKSISHFPDERLPAGVEILNATDGMEMWEVLVQYAEQRTAACLHIDADVPLEPCP